MKIIINENPMPEWDEEAKEFRTPLFNMRVEASEEGEQVTQEDAMAACRAELQNRYGKPESTN